MKVISSTASAYHSACAAPSEFASSHSRCTAQRVIRARVREVRDVSSRLIAPELAHRREPAKSTLKALGIKPMFPDHAVGRASPISSAPDPRSIFLVGRISCGKPMTTFPENALLGLAQVTRAFDAFDSPDREKTP
jgi:hypothetical protein